MTRADFFRSLAALPFVGWLVGRVEPEDPADRMPPPNEPGAPNILITVDPIDPRYPNHQKLIGDAFREYHERFKGRIRRVD